MKNTRGIIIVGAIFAITLLGMTVFSGNVYAKTYNSMGRAKVQISLPADINKKAYNKALLYSQIDLINDFNAISPKAVEKIPLYSPQGKLIYYYVLFKDGNGQEYFSIVSVSYRYSPVICEGAGYGYISSLRNAEQKVIDKAFREGILRAPLQPQILDYIYFGQLSFGYSFYGGYFYVMEFNRFLRNVNFENNKSTLIKYRERTRDLWNTINETLDGRNYTKSWWTKGMLYDSYVPYIEWYKGCVPTSLAMIVGYLRNYGFTKFPWIAHIVYSDGYNWISDSNAREVIEFLVNYWDLSSQNGYGVQWWKIEDGVWALIYYYGYIPTHNSLYGDIETIYRGGLNRLAWNDYDAIVDGIKRWHMPSFVGLTHSHKYGNHGVVAVGYKYHADFWGWHDKRLFIHDTWITSLVEYHIDGDFSWWDPWAHYDVLNFYPVHH